MAYGNVYLLYVKYAIMYMKISTLAFFGDVSEYLLKCLFFGLAQ